MAENRTEAIVGAAVLVVAAAFGVTLSGAAGGGGGTAGSYPLEASFRSVEGVSVGTDVRLAGVKIGSVTGIELDAETFRAETTFAIDPGVEIPEDSAVIISSEGLLGGNFVEVQPGGSLMALPPGASFTDTQGSVSLITLLLRAFTGEGE